MSKDIIQAIGLCSIDSNAFTGGYDLMVGSPLTNPISLLRIINDSNRDITISYDGVNAHDYLPSDDTLQLSFQTNSGPNNYVAKLSRGTNVYIKGLAAGTGLVYLAGYYQI